MDPAILLLALLLPQQVEIHEASLLIRPVAEARTAVFGSHLAPASEDRSLAASFRDSYLGEPSPAPLVSPAALEEMLRRVAGSGASFEFLDHSLVVQGSKEVQQSVRDTLADLGRAVAPIGLEVLLVEPPAGFAPRGVLLGREETEAIASGAPVARGTFSVYPGSTVSLSRRDDRWIVRDYDVEVAQRSTIADPLLARVLAGYGLDVRVHPVSGGRVHLTLLADRASLLEVREVATEAQGLGVLEIPRIATHALASTLVVPDGATAIVGALGAPGREGAGVLVVVRPRLPAPDAPRLLGAVPVGLLADVGGRLPPAVGERLEPSRAEEQEAPSASSVPAPRFLEWFRESIGGAEYEEVFGREGLALAASANLVLTRGASTDALARLLAFRDSLESAFARSAGLVVEILDPSGAPLQTALLSVTQGRSCAAVIGVETTKIADYDAEIAQRAAIADPVVEPEFEGLVLLATAGSIDATGATLDLELRVRRAAPERRIPPTAEKVGVLTEVPVAQTALRRRVRLRPGETLDLGSVPSAAEGDGPARARIRLTSAP